MKGMFYLKMYSVHFIYEYMQQTYGKEPNSDSERKAAAATMWSTLFD